MTAHSVQKHDGGNKKGGKGLLAWGAKGQDLDGNVKRNQNNPPQQPFRKGLGGGEHSYSSKMRKQNGGSQGLRCAKPAKFNGGATCELSQRRRQENPGCKTDRKEGKGGGGWKVVGRISNHRARREKEIVKKMLKESYRQPRGGKGKGA